MKTGSPLLAVLLALLLPTPSGHAEDSAPRSPFGIAVAAGAARDGTPVWRVDFTVPPECVLYADRLHFRTADGAEIQPLKLPEPVVETDLVTGKPRKVFVHDFTAEVNPSALPDHQLVVKFQGCTNAACFFPEQRRFALDQHGWFAEVLAPAAAGPAGSGVGAINWPQAFHDFTVKGQQTGYLNAPEFMAFLDGARTGRGTVNPLDQLQSLGTLASLLLILGGGFLLNFTPCVLPMIPINLAIIGAGSRARSRLEGFRNGAVYGLGMALAYGTLGLVVILTGSKFGTLNSAPWFNLGIALVFVVMALGMFEVVHIDLSRFSVGGPVAPAGRVALAQQAVVLSMGVMSALLAGACVAPVVISVVLLATHIYATGTSWGLLLPFLLGAGMALPWPFAGAGLACLPRPGRWMRQVKQGFGLIILGFAGYYGHLAWQAHQLAGNVNPAQGAGPAPAMASLETDQTLLAALQQSRVTGRPLFIDFHAGWCKDCAAMDATVFNRPDVNRRLQNFVAVRYAAERPNEAPARPLLDHFGIVGLPTYLVLSPQ